MGQQGWTAGPAPSTDAWTPGAAPSARSQAATDPRASERTNLSPSEETAFNAWVKQNGITDVDDPRSFYDYRGYWKDIASKGGDQRKQYDDGLHFPDMYKQHGHPTFSIESKYSKGGDDGGRWDGETYIPQLPPQTIGTAADAAWQAMKGGAAGMWKASGIPGLFRGGMVEALKDQGDVAKGILQGQYDQYRKAKLAEAEGRPWEMLGHSVAAGIPFLGPLAASIGERAGTGDIAGAAGEAGGDALMAVGPELTLKGAQAVFDPKVRAARAVKQAAAAGAATEGHLMMAIPSTKAAPWTVEDLRAAKPYINAQHAATPINSTVGLRDALDSAIGEIEGQVSKVVQAFPEAQLHPNVAPALAEAFKDSPRAGALEAGIKELNDLPLDRALTLPELDRLRLQLNAENRAILKKNNYDQATARLDNPGFLARETAARVIRDRLYDYLEERGVEGVRQLRRDEGSVIKLRNAAERQTMAGGRTVAGSSDPSFTRRAVAQVAEKGTTAAGVAAGAAVGGPAGAVAGGVLGSEAGANVGRAIKGSRLTRDELVARAFANADGRLPSYPAVPPRPKIAGELPPAPIELGGSPDTSYARGVPAEPARRIVRGELPPARESIPMGAGPDTSGRIEPTLPENINRPPTDADTGEIQKSAPKDERSFILRWLADEMRDLPFQQSSRMRGAAEQDEFGDRAYGEKNTRYAGRVGGTKIQEMFHALGVNGTRAEIAAKLDHVMRGGKGNPKITQLADSMIQAWDGHRFDFDLISDEQVADLGIRRRDFRHPETTPWPDDMPDVFDRFFQKNKEAHAAEVAENDRIYNERRAAAQEAKTADDGAEDFAFGENAAPVAAEGRIVSPSVISKQQMIDRGADGHLSKAIEAEIPIDKLDGLEPVPAADTPDGKYKPGREITQPIEVAYDAGSGKYMVYGGNHRIAQAKANGQATIRAFVEPDGKDIGISRSAADPIGKQLADLNAPESMRAEAPAEKEYSKQDPWYKAHGDAAKEKAFAAMRALDGKIERARARAEQLAPSTGEKAVGASHFDAFLEYDAPRKVLGYVREGLSPIQAATKAKEWIRGVIEEHNGKRNDPYWKRDKGAADDLIDRAALELAEAVEGGK